MKAVVAALVCLLIGGCGPAAGWPSEVARPPGFRLIDLAGKPRSLDDFQGKVVVLNFWATWCIPCRAEMPDLEHEYRAHKNNGLVVLGIDSSEDPAAAAQFV